VKIIQHPSPNHGPRPRGVEPDLILIHGSAGRSIKGDLAWLSDQAHDEQGNHYDTSLSYTYEIDGDGLIYQLVPESRRAWHAGVSSWEGREDCNDYSIGIALRNLGDDPDLYRAGEPFPEPYTDAQYEALVWLSADIMHRRPIITERRIVGHADVSPGRKTDPWAHFNWARFRVGLRLALHPAPKMDVEIPIVSLPDFPGAIMPPALASVPRPRPALDRYSGQRPILQRAEAKMADVDKNAALEFLRKELTEERTDEVLQFLSEQAKIALPDLPVEMAEQVLDWLVPGKLLDAIETKLT
jgi:AmpD protein